MSSPSAAVKVSRLTNGRIPERAQRKNASLIIKWLIGICFFYMLAFPKGGVKVQEIPITIGYILIIPVSILALLLNAKTPPPREKVIALFLCLITALWSYVCYSQNGGGTFAHTAAYFVAITVIPIFCLLFVSDGIFANKFEFLEKVIVAAVRFVATFGIFLFLYKYFTGSWIEIPYFTVNVDDVGALDEKHINRGGIFKLISTYNNGNIFGVSMAILAPFYLFLERRIAFRAIFYIALILTLSRTVWIGLLLIIIFESLSRKYTAQKIIAHSLFFIVGVLIVYGVMIGYGLDNEGFIFDRNLGGRLVQFLYLENSFFIPSARGIDVPEIVYIGIAYNYGYFGLILFCAMLIWPVVSVKMRGVAIFSKRKAAKCAQGLIIYLIIAASDGAFSYIPVMLIYWLVAGLAIWYSVPVKVLRGRGR